MIFLVLLYRAILMSLVSVQTAITYAIFGLFDDTV